MVLKSVSPFDRCVQSHILPRPDHLRLAALRRVTISPPSKKGALALSVSLLGVPHSIAFGAIEVAVQHAIPTHALGSHARCPQSKSSERHFIGYRLSIRLSDHAESTAVVPHRPANAVPR